MLNVEAKLLLNELLLGVCVEEDFESSYFCTVSVNLSKLELVLCFLRSAYGDGLNVLELWTFIAIFSRGS